MSTTETIIRIAHREREHHRIDFPAGPYQDRNRGWSSEYLVWDDTPSPEEDGLDTPFSDDAFGFADVHALIRWFGPALDSLKDDGYLVWVYTVPEDAVQHGGHQTMFKHARATFVRAVEIEEFLRETGML